MNIYQVINNNDLYDLINSTNDKLVVAMFTNYSSFDKQLSYKLKKAFFDVSKAYTFNVFIYIDLNNFDGDYKNFTQEEDFKIPRFCYYYNKDNLGFVQGLNLNKFVEQLDFINSKLKEIKIKNKELQDNNINSEQNNKPLVKKTHKIIYKNQNITPSDLKIILSNYGVYFNEELDIFESIYSYINKNKIEKNTSNNKEEELDFETLEKLKRLKQINTTKNIIKMKLTSQLMTLKKLKQMKELEELKQKKLEQENNIE